MSEARKVLEKKQAELKNAINELCTNFQVETGLIVEEITVIHDGVETGDNVTVDVVLGF